MAPEMLCKLPKVSSTDNFEDLLEDMELDEELLRELLEEVNDENVEQMSMMETGLIDPHTKEKNDYDSFHVLPDNESQLVLYHQDKQIQDLDYWITQQIGEMPCSSSFPGLWFENEVMPFWNMENLIEDVMMVDDIAYVELWED